MYYLLFTKITVELDQNKNFESDTVGFQVHDGCRISEKALDSEYVASLAAIGVK